MKTFRVTWEIKVDAESAREAAEIALRIQREPASIATVFDVFDETGEKHTVDLLEEPPADCKHENPIALGILAPSVDAYGVRKELKRCADCGALFD